MDTLRLTGSYLVAPAKYASSTLWYALGYPVSAPASRPQPPLAPSNSSSEPFSHAPSTPSLEIPDDGLEEQVVRALREAMQEGAREEGVVGARPVSAPASDLGTGHPTAHDEGDDDELSASEEAQPAPPLGNRPPSLCEAARDPVDGPDERASAPTVLSCGKVAPPVLDELVLLAPRPRPLSSLSRLSRRATLCLSTLSLLDTAIDDSLSTATADEPDGTDPSEQEQVLIERALKKEVEQVREEVEEAVESALSWEEELKVLGSGEAAEEEEQDARTNESEQERKRGQEPVPKEEMGTAVKAVTWFDTPEGQAFARLRGAGDLDTDGIVLALSSLVSLTERVAPAASALCAGEVDADIRRIQARKNAHPHQSKTVAQLVASERRERRKLATESLRWFIALLGFVALALRITLDDPQQELGESITQAWDRGFKHHVNWLVRPIFKVMMRACPTRQAVCSRLMASGDAPVPHLEQQLSQWIQDVEEVVCRLRDIVPP